jgi:PKD repeat protein
VLPVEVFTPPTANFRYTSIPCENGKVSFQDSSFAYQTTIVSWKWEFAPYQYSTAQNPVYIYYDMDSCYNVKLISTDFRGCSDTVDKQVCVPAALDIAFEAEAACLGNSTKFHPLLLAPGKAIDSLVFYNWSFGDPESGINNYSTDSVPEHLYARTGIYTVQLEATDTYNCTDVFYKEVTINPLPAVTFTYQEGVCDSTITFNRPVSAGGSPIKSWHWEFGDGKDSLFEMPAPHPLILEHVYSDVGFYPVILTVINQDGCENTIDTTVWVKPCLNAGFGSSDTLICQNNNFTFADTTERLMPDALWNWKWYFGDGSDTLSYTTFRPFVTHIFSTTGPDTVKMWISAIVSGKFISDSAIMVIDVKPSPLANFKANNVCFSDSVIFENLSIGNGTNINSYKWDFKDHGLINDSSILANPVYSYSIAGEYWPKLIVEDSIIGCTDTIEYKVSVNALPIAAISINNPCVSQFTKFIDKSISGNSVINLWNWSITNENGFWQPDTLQNPSFVFETIGDYLAQLIVKDANGCADTVTNQKFTVFPSPESGFSYVEKADPVNEKWQLIFTNESVHADSSAYEWNFGNGKYSHAVSPVTTYENEDVYSIRLISRNSGTCADTLIKKYRYIYKGLYIPNAFWPDDMMGKVNIFQPTGIGLKTFDIKIFDRWGNLLWESSTEQLIDGSPGPGWDGKYKGEFVPAGVYVWKASAVFNDGTVWTGISMGENKGLSGADYGTITLIR